MFTSLSQISPTEWNKLKPETNPFLSYEFFEALEKSGSIGNKSGWMPLYFKQDQGLLYTFIKNHSYGEYIFDWEWARAFKQAQLPYYPKLTSMLPFTPVTTSHFIMPTFDEKIANKLLESYHLSYDAHEFSSSHFLFLSPPEVSFFKSQGYMIRESLQYHFFNEGYDNFEEYLSALKGSKAKNIRKERIFPDLAIRSYTGEHLTAKHAQQMYHFYLSTIDHKNGINYLTESFFQLLFERMRENILYVEATGQAQPVAGSLFFFDQTTLYGRYWGTNSTIQNLHFELCYYQGIDFCLSKKLKVFEAGAQGEHKIPRGFRPTKTFSAHRIKNPVFAKAIALYIEDEKKYVEDAMRELSKQLPFRS